VFVRDSDPQAWTLKALREAGNSIVREIAGLDEEALCQRPSEDDLCLKEIAAHLRDATELALRQMEAMADGAAGALPFWDIDLLPLERDYRSADTSDLLTEFLGLRRDTTQLLWALREHDWRASGRHPYRGEITVETVARELAQHDLEHLWQIRRLKYGHAGA